MMQPTLPPGLKPGDAVAVVYPAGPIRDQAAFAVGLQVLHDLGLQVRHHPPHGSVQGYLAADDRQRLLELHRLWADDEVKALIAARGGYGCLRIMSGLDWAFLRSRPKWLIGFSDLTVMVNGLFEQTGLVGLHGPMISTLGRLDRPSFDRFREALRSDFRPLACLGKVEVLRNGIGQGRLIGGNLTTLAHMMGTPWQPRTNGAILFLEDTAEPAYKLDRMLTHLASCGLLDGLAGLILGWFDPGSGDRLETLRLNEQVWGRVLELVGSAGYPIWGGFPIGHQQQNVALPVGMEAVMNGINGMLELLPRSCRSS